MVGDELRRSVFERDGHACRNCGSDENLYAHHIVPEAAGGGNFIDNLATLCGECHRAAHGFRIADTIRDGVEEAQDSGKWTGRPPVGFSVEDGYLRVEPEEFLRAQDALQRVLDGEPIVDVADEVGIAESTLRRLRDERRELYLDAEPDDERVATALDEAGVEEVDTPTDELEELRERVENLEEEAGK
jgi:transposase-like protein